MEIIVKESVHGQPSIEIYSEGLKENFLCRTVAWRFLHEKRDFVFFYQCGSFGLSDYHLFEVWSNKTVEDCRSLIDDLRSFIEREGKQTLHFYAFENEQEMEEYLRR